MRGQTKRVERTKRQRGRINKESERTRKMQSLPSSASLGSRVCAYLRTSRPLGIRVHAYLHHSCADPAPLLQKQKLKFFAQFPPSGEQNLYNIWGRRWCNFNFLRGVQAHLDGCVCTFIQIRIQIHTFRPQIHFLDPPEILNFGSWDRTPN